MACNIRKQMIIGYVIREAGGLLKRIFEVKQSTSVDAKATRHISLQVCGKILIILNKHLDRQEICRVNCVEQQICAFMFIAHKHRFDIKCVKMTEQRKTIG